MEENKNIEEQVALEQPVEKKISKPKTQMKVDKVSMTALALAVIALGLSAMNFLSTGDSVSSEEFDSFKQSSKQTVMKTVNTANEADRNDIETLQSNLQALRQELEVVKQDVSSSKLEISEKLANETNELSNKMKRLQDSLKNTPVKKKVAPREVKKSPLPAKMKTKKLIKR